MSSKITSESGTSAEAALETVVTVRDRIRDDESETGRRKNALVSQLEATETSLQRALESVGLSAPPAVPVRMPASDQSSVFGPNTAVSHTF